MVLFYVAKTKALISFSVTAKLIYVFVFAYAKYWFSHDAAQFIAEIAISSNSLQMPEDINFKACNIDQGGQCRAVCVSLFYFFKLYLFALLWLCVTSSAQCEKNT